MVKEYTNFGVCVVLILCGCTYCIKIFRTWEQTTHKGPAGIIPVACRR